MCYPINISPFQFTVLLCMCRNGSFGQILYSISSHHHCWPCRYSICSNLKREELMAEIDTAFSFSIRDRSIRPLYPPLFLSPSLFFLTDYLHICSMTQQKEKRAYIFWCLYGLALLFLSFFVACLGIPHFLLLFLDFALPLLLFPFHYSLTL